MQTTVIKLFVPAKLYNEKTYSAHQSWISIYAYCTSG